MAILVDKDTRLCVSGITGREGTFHTLRNRDYGTQVVSGVTPGKGGQDVEGIPVFDTFHEAVAETGANTAMVFVPPRFAADSILEAEDAGIELIITITEGIPAHDELRVYNHLQRGSSRLIGPNCPGILSPGKANVGIIPAQFFKEGNVGLVSRSGTLTYQIGNELAQRGFGNSSIVGIGGDPVPGSSFIDIIERFEADDETELIVMCGEIGGDSEERAADYIGEHVSKPVVAYIAGFTAPPGKTMGHAGAIVSGSKGTARPRPRRWRPRACAWGATPPRWPRSRPRSWARRSSRRPGRSVGTRRTLAPLWFGLPSSGSTRDVEVAEALVALGQAGALRTARGPVKLASAAGVADRVVEPDARRPPSASPLQRSSRRRRSPPPTMRAVPRAAAESTTGWSSTGSEVAGWGLARPRARWRWTPGVSPGAAGASSSSPPTTVTRRITARIRSSAPIRRPRRRGREAPSSLGRKAWSGTGGALRARAPRRARSLGGRSARRLLSASAALPRAPRQPPRAPRSPLASGSISASSTSPALASSMLPSARGRRPAGGRRSPRRCAAARPGPGPPPRGGATARAAHGGWGRAAPRASSQAFRRSR